MTTLADAALGALHLPEGTATLAPGMAVYLIAGEPIDVDVEIPEDLKAASWFWHGSFLCWEGTSPGLWLATSTFGLPGVFEIAREIEMKRRSVVLEPAQMALWEG